MDIKRTFRVVICTESKNKFLAQVTWNRAEALKQVIRRIHGKSKLIENVEIVGSVSQIVPCFCTRFTESVEHRYVGLVIFLSSSMIEEATAIQERLLYQVKVFVFASAERPPHDVRVFYRREYSPDFSDFEHLVYLDSKIRLFFGSSDDTKEE